MHGIAQWYSWLTVHVEDDKMLSYSCVGLPFIDYSKKLTELCISRA